MAYLEGHTVKDQIADRPLKLDQALDIAIQTAQGLQAAHDKGIVHRDIKSANLMVTPQGQVKIMDFGLAQLAERSKLTETTAILGTPSYMSPEQAVGEKTDRRTDLWSLGVVLYEMVTGRLPFEGERQEAILYGISHQEPEPVTARRAGLPMELEWIVDKALAKDCDERYQHAEDLLVDLHSLQKKLASGTASKSTALDRPRSSVPAWPIAVGLALLAAAVMFWAGKQSQSPEQRKSWRITRVTSTPEWEFNLSASPASGLIAYSSMAHGNLEIYVMPVGGGKPLRLTTHQADDTQPRLSPDGELVVFHSGRDGSLYEVPVTGGVPRRIARTNHRHVEGIIGAQPWRTESGRQELLFSRWDGEGRAAIWKIDPASLEESQISKPGEGEAHTAASYSPDGRRIVFNREVGTSRGLVGLWTMRAEGGETQPIVQDEFANRMAAWTSAGDRIVFESDRSGAQNLWELTIGSGELQPVTVGPGWDRHPLVVPGKGLFYTQFSHTLNLYSVNLDNGTHERLTIGSEFQQINPRFSPDGRFLVFDSNRGGDFEVFNLDLETGESRPLSDNSAHDRYPDWSPVSDELLFVSTRSRSPELWLMDGNGGSSRWLDPGPTAIRPAFSVFPHDTPGPPQWSAGGRVIGYVGVGENGPELWSVRPDGGAAKRLLTGVHSFDWYGDSGNVVVYCTTRSEAGSEGAELRAINLDKMDEVVLLEGLYGNLDVAPDTSSVAYLTQHGLPSQQYFVLPLTPPKEPSGLPRSAGPPKPLTEGGGFWHTHGGSFSPDTSSFVYDRDTDKGDILLVENYN